MTMLVSAASASSQGLANTENQAPLGTSISLENWPLLSLKKEGGFAYLANAQSGIARLTDTGYFCNATTGGYIAAPINRPTGVTGAAVGVEAMHVVVPDGQGGWYFGGTFTTIGGLVRTGIVRLSASGVPNPAFDAQLTLVPLGPAGVTGLAVSGGTLYLAGSFSAVGGQPRTGLAAVNATTGAVLPWAPTIAGGSYTPTGTYATAITVSGNSAYVGGDFTSANGVARRGLAAFDAATGGLLPWDPTTAADPVVIAVKILPVGNRIALCGTYIPSLGGSPRSNLACVDGITGLPDAWAPVLTPIGAPHMPVTDLVHDGGVLHVAGAFNAVDGTPRAGYAGFAMAPGSAPATAPTGLDPLAPSAVGAYAENFAFDGTNVFVTGNFTQFGGVARRYAASFVAATNAITTFDPLASNAATAIAVAGGTAVLTCGVGEFTLGGKLLQVDLATGGRGPLNPAFNSATPFPFPVPGGNGSVFDCAPIPGAVFVGGIFALVDSQPATNLAKIDTITGALLPFAPNPNGFVDSLSTWGGVLYVGGAFSTIAGQARAGFAAFDIATGALLPWTATATQGGVTAGKRLRAEGGHVWVFGSFDTVNGLPRRNLAALDTATGAMIAFDAGITNGNIVKSAAVVGETIYYAGDFSAVGGQTRIGIAASSIANSALLSFAPSLTAGSTSSQPRMVTGMTAAAGRIYVVSNADLAVNGAARPYIAEIDAVSGQPTPFVYQVVPGPGFVGASVADPIFYGGRLYAVARSALRSFDALQPAASATTVGGGCGLALTIDPPVLGGYALAATTGAAFGDLGVLAFGAPAVGGAPPSVCALRLDLLQPLILLPATVNIFGGFTLGFGLPFDSAWWGLTIRAQTATVSPLGVVQFSNAVDLVFGY